MIQDSQKPVLVFSDDWGRHPSSCQHLVGKLLDRHQFYWVNTIGMRPPRVDWTTVRRAVGKLRQWIRPRIQPRAADGPENPRILNPRMWPWFTRSLDRQVNRKLLLRQLLPAIKDLHHTPVAVTTIPIVADLMTELPVSRWVYYCVDDFSKWPGLDHSALEKMERKVVHKADILIAASEKLRERLMEMGRDAFVLTHGVDLEFWGESRKSGKALDQIEGLEPPFVTFWGVLDRRLDLDFLRTLAASLARGTILLAGPENDHDPALNQVPRLKKLGSLPFVRLPDLAQISAVLIMPYAELDVTRAMQPLKLKEYLASKKPAVVRDLPATRPWADTADLASSPGQFARLVMERLNTGLPESQAMARKRLIGESWDAKACMFENWALLDTTHGNHSCCA